MGQSRTSSRPLPMTQRPVHVGCSRVLCACAVLYTAHTKRDHVNGSTSCWPKPIATTIDFVWTIGSECDNAVRSSAASSLSPSRRRMQTHAMRTSAPGSSTEPCGTKSASEELTNMQACAGGTWLLLVTAHARMVRP